MDIWVKLAVVLVIVFFVYREIIQSVTRPTQRKKATLLNVFAVGSIVGIFTYIGISISLIETRDLRPLKLPSSQEFVSIYDKGVIEVGGMVIKTNLAKPGELSSLANELTMGCQGNDGCEAQKLFDYVTKIPYKSDHTSRNAMEVVRSNWGDCDDKSNLYASLLNERGLDYRFVYVSHHVFVVVHINDTALVPFINARLRIDGQDYYYAETTAAGVSVGTFNGQFPFMFEGVYDMKEHKEDNLKEISFVLR